MTTGGSAHYGRKSLIAYTVGRSKQGAEIDKLFGRDGEVAAIRTFLDDIAAGPASLVLEGEVGSGKTALWRAAVAAARERGHLVLVSRANEAEASLAFAALGDLLRDVAGEELTRLPAPQATALRVAVLLQEPEGPTPDPLAVSVATLGLVRALAVGRPVLIALDDYVWLDAASTNVLAFVLRRLETERIGVLGTVRANGEHAAPPLLDEATTGRPPRRVQQGWRSVFTVRADRSEARRQVRFRADAARTPGHSRKRVKPGVVVKRDQDGPFRGKRANKAERGDGDCEGVRWRTLGFLKEDRHAKGRRLRRWRARQFLASDVAEQVAERGKRQRCLAFVARLTRTRWPRPRGGDRCAPQRRLAGRPRPPGRGGRSAAMSSRNVRMAATSLSRPNSLSISPPCLHRRPCIKQRLARSARSPRWSNDCGFP